MTIGDHRACKLRHHLFDDALGVGTLRQRLLFAPVLLHEELEQAQLDLCKARVDPVVEAAGIGQTSLHVGGPLAQAGNHLNTTTTATATATCTRHGQRCRECKLSASSSGLERVRLTSSSSFVTMGAHVMSPR